MLSHEQLKGWLHSFPLQTLRAQLSIDGARPESALTTRDLGQLERDAPGRIIAPGPWLFAMQRLSLIHI
eukprot:4917070-Alexandrium_andersonii.AAC.1